MSIERFLTSFTKETLEPTTPEIDPPNWEKCRNAFTPRQREAIRYRDNYKCNFPAEHDCGGRNEVHHILAQAFANKMGVNPDYPENALTICKNAHEMVHPDTAKARKLWKPKGDSFLKVQAEREQKLKNREIYWNPTWDRPMTVVAVRNTQRAREQGWKFPGEQDMSDPRVERLAQEDKQMHGIIYEAKSAGD